MTVPRPSPADPISTDPPSGGSFPLAPHGRGSPTAQPAPDGASDDQVSRGAAWDRTIAALANEQHGVVSTAQLLDAGLTTRAIAGRVRRCQLHRLYRGVYSVGHRVLGPRGWWMASVLAAGDGALLSHRAAGCLWGILDGAPDVVDVVSTGSVRRARGLRVHRVRRIDPRDRSRNDAIPCTSLARTLLDLASVLDSRRLDRAIRRAEDLRLFDRYAIDEVLLRGRPGSSALRSAIEAFAQDHAAGVRTKSLMELEFRGVRSVEVV